MADSKPTTLMRVPTHIKKKLDRLKAEKNLSTLGEALKFWIEQQVDEKVRKELPKLEKNLDKIASAMNNFSSSEAARAAQWILLLEEIRPGLSQKVSSLFIYEKYRQLVEAIKEDLEKR